MRKTFWDSTLMVAICVIAVSAVILPPAALPSNRSGAISPGRGQLRRLLPDLCGVDDEFEWVGILALLSSWTTNRAGGTSQRHSKLISKRCSR
jgi:hypothetical protein